MSHAHRWKPLKVGYEKCLVCECGAMHVRGVQVGANTISMSPSGVGDVVRWSATKNAVASGDLGMNVTSGRPNVFVSSAVRSLIHTLESGGTLGLGFSGDGSDGNTTLVANTTLAADDNVRLYNDLTTSGFSLTSNSADVSLVIYARGTASISSGSAIAAQTFGAISSGGAGGGGGGTGGVGGISAGSVFVYAATITGTGVVRANGTDGSVGGGGSATASGNTGGTGGVAGTSTARLFGDTFTTTASGGGGAGNTGGAGGSGGTAGVRNALAPDVFQDCNRFMIGFGGTDGHTVGTDSNDRWMCGTTGASGGGGGGNTGTGGGGGGGGGGGAFVNDGGLGGSGGTNSGVNGTGSGGGGAGGSAGVAIVIANSLSGISVQANGGIGGPGGPANPASVSGGGGGGGGSGGLALVIGQNGHSGGSSASAGTAGAGGIGAGVSGTSGASGGAGIAFNSAWS